MSNTTATITGREKLAKARAGIAPLAKAAYIALGDGGADKTPAETATELYNEIIRKPITMPTFPATTTARYPIKLETNECAGIAFNEIGLFDDDGELIAIKTFSPKQKDDDMEMVFEIEDIF